MGGGGHLPSLPDASYSPGSCDFPFAQTSRKHNPGGGVLSYIGYTGMCRWRGYGFQVIWSGKGYGFQAIWSASGVGSSNHDAHTDPIFKDLEILKFNCVYRFHVSKMLIQLKNNVLPSAFSSIILFNYQMQGYFTRTSNQFHIPKIRTNIKKFSICYQGPKIFNSLPTDIQFSNTLSSFSCKLYKFLLSQ